MQAEGWDFEEDIANEDMEVEVNKEEQEEQRQQEEEALDEEHRNLDKLLKKVRLLSMFWGCESVTSSCTRCSACSVVTGPSQQLMADVLLHGCCCAFCASWAHLCQRELSFERVPESVHRRAEMRRSWTRT